MAELEVVNEAFEQPAPLRGLFVLGPPLLLMVVALLLGGASRLNPLGLMVAEIFGLLALAPAALRSPDLIYSRLGLTALLILALTAALPLMQLMPLPPDVWKGLPGRAPLAHAVSLLGLPDRWRPMSLAPDQTAGAIFFLLAPIGMFVAALQCNARQRFWLVIVVIVIAVLSLPVGGIQAATGSSTRAQFYAAATAGLPNGFFANRNHQASFLISAMALSAVLLGPHPLPGDLGRRPLPIVGLMLLFAVGAAATLSRAGLFLAGPVMVGAMVVMYPRLRGSGSLGRIAILIGVVLAIVTAVAVVKGGALFSRLEAGTGVAGRISILPKVIEAGGALQPVGSGIGAFDTVYRAVEPLDQVMPAYLNHVHDDYVELWLEAGWPAVGLIAAMIAWCGYAAFRAWTGPARADSALARAGSLAAAVFLIHSTVDYPLRTPALAVVFALACALMVPTPVKRGG